jgi:predicted RNA-binding Zn-ribbon protein involved in translation (DUF1610 family)
MPIQVTCMTCRRAFNAPDNAAGKRAKCPSCGGAIDIPSAAAPPAPPPPPKDDVLDAIPDEPRSFADEDFDDLEVEAPIVAPQSNDGRKPCPMCGEMIQSNAVKCRYCGEIFDPLLRAQAKKASSPGDEDLSVLEWVIAILCSGIGCIVGIIYIVQGKPKGKKMLLVSICVQFFWAAVQAIIGFLAQQ